MLWSHVRFTNNVWTVSLVLQDARYAAGNSTDLINHLMMVFWLKKIEYFIDRELIIEEVEPMVSY
jgi:hypothetical protein